MMLYIVATPIGNLEDITLRGLRILKEVDFIVAEDTRHTLKLLNHFEVHKPLMSFFEHQEEKKLGPILEKLKTGQRGALVTDAGTPGISDPGFRLIRKAIEEKIEVVPIPGASAVMTALQAAGLPTDSFLFVGFLPEKPGKRKRVLESLKNFPHTIVFYLSRWKALRQIQEMVVIFGDRKVCLAREMTKLHEEFWRGSLKGLLDRMTQHPLKGEFTLVVSGFIE